MVFDREHIFFLGIGGIGMSALASFLHQSGYKISGYDRDKTAITKKLELLGIKIQYDFNDAELEDSIDMVVYTPAIKPDHKEFQYFSIRNIEMIKRSEALKKVLQGKKVIAIAGTHGKTSTSAILAHILKYASFGATAFVGGVMSNYGTNFLYGDSDWVIIEADEYDRSFWRLYPDVAVIQAMDADHLDIYGTEADMIDAYRVFSLQIQNGGRLFLSDKASDKVGEEWRGELEQKKILSSDFGLSATTSNVLELVEANGSSSFRLKEGGALFQLHLAGIHNVYNALGAISVAEYLGLPEEMIAEALNEFTGIERRFQYVLKTEKTIIIDDYAHHPVEIEAAIKASRKHHPDRKLTVVFQPHLYSRTNDFMDDFAVSLGEADELILVELYPARELPIEGVSSERLLAKVELDDKVYVPKSDLVEYLGSPKRELILLLGAGDVYKLIDKLKEKYS